jgi:type II secretory pathway component PulF
MSWFGRLQRSSQLSIFSRTLGLLIDSGQPLPESLVLAAQATGSRRLGRAAAEAKAAIEQGAPATEALRRCGLPPLVCWLLGASSAQPELGGTLRRLADDYQQRAIYQAERIRLFLPLLLTVGVAGTAVAAYALMLFLPWTTVMREVAGP